jgi:quinolinate synthase
MSRLVPGPHLILVVPEQAVYYHYRDVYPEVEILHPESPPRVLAMASQETPTRHSQMACSFSAMTQEQREELSQRLRKLADFIDAHGSHQAPE